MRVWRDGEIKEEEKPKIEDYPGKILIEIKATAVNRADTLERKGLYPAPPSVKGTYCEGIMGLEAAGVIEQVTLSLLSLLSLCSLFSLSSLFTSSWSALNWPVFQ